MNWLRLYSDIKDDPKILQFSPENRWYYVGLLCVSSEETVRGNLPSVEFLAISLRIRQAKVRSLLAMFKKAGLIDEDVTTKALTIHGWEARQRQSDDAAARMSRIRNERKAATCSEHVLPKNEPHACASETETETEKESLQAGFARTPAREIVPEIKADPEWEPQPIPDESMSGRSGKDHADFVRACRILDSHHTTRRLANELRMTADTPGVQMLRGWQLVCGALTCQRPDKGKTWGGLMAFARNATETEYDRLSSQAPARTSGVDRPPPKSAEQMQAELEESNRKFLEYQAKQRANR